MDHPSFPEIKDPLKLVTMFTQIGHGGATGLRYHGHGLKNGKGWCAFELPWRADLVSDAATGILASGPIFTMMDMATSISIWLTTNTFQPQVTLDLRIDYLRPARPGNSVIGHGECYHITRSVAFVRGFAHDGDPEKPIAHVAGTYFFTASGQEPSV